MLCTFDFRTCESMLCGAIFCFARDYSRRSCSFADNCVLELVHMSQATFFGDYIGHPGLCQTTLLLLKRGAGLQCRVVKRVSLPLSPVIRCRV